MEYAQLFSDIKGYDLIVAEGGTGLGHCVTVARSKNIKGQLKIPVKKFRHQTFYSQSTD